MSSSNSLFHTLLDGPFIFSNSRPVYYDFKVLWALMYHYRNQQRSSFHFHRLNLLMKSAKRFRNLELSYIDSQDLKLLDELLECVKKMKESSLIAGAAIEKLIQMKLYMPFALTAEAAIASIYSKIDFLVNELELTKDPNKNQDVKQPNSTTSSKLKTPIDRMNVKDAKVEKPKQQQQSKGVKPPRPEKLSKLSSMRKPLDKKDEIDDIFGDA